MRLAGTEEGRRTDVITEIRGGFLHNLVPWNGNPHAVDLDLVAVSHHAPGCRPAIATVATRTAGIGPNETLIEVFVKPVMVVGMVSVVCHQAV
jgi:hypothetical protein